MELILFIALMLAVGSGVGIMSAALGVGGGVLMVPAFVYFFPEMDMNTAKGSSLLVIVFVTSYNSWRMNRGEMRSSWSAINAIAFGSVFGGFAGGWLTGRMSDAAVTWIFVALLGFAGTRMFFISPRTVHDNEVRRRKVVAPLIGLASGFVAGATGTGGGAILVPFALLAGVVSNERVVALSNSVMAVAATAGMLGHLFSQRTVDMPWTFGLVNVAVAPVVVIGAVASAPLGRWLNAKLSFEGRRIVMAVLLLAIALRLCFRALG